MHDVRSTTHDIRMSLMLFVCVYRAQIVRDFALASYTVIGLAECQRKFAQAIIHAADTPEHVGASGEVCRKYCAFSLGFQ